jgi:hypothetical protein
LFALLNFICQCPEIFMEYADLDSFLHVDENWADEENEKSMKVVEALHKILSLFTAKGESGHGEELLTKYVAYLTLFIYFIYFANGADSPTITEKEVNI